MGRLWHSAILGPAESHHNFPAHPVVPRGFATLTVRPERQMVTAPHGNSFPPLLLLWLGLLISDGFLAESET